jgi:N-acetylneuraminate synthase
VIVVALGAKIMERHVTLDHNMWGSDLFASLEVHVMDMLCKRIKDIDVILGDSVKGFAKNEIEIRKNYVDISIGLYFDYLWRL